jgi:hypothetical protein
VGVQQITYGRGHMANRNIEGLKHGGNPVPGSLGFKIIVNGHT